MNFQGANPQDEEYWWIVDEDGEATVVFISVNDKTGNALANYIGTEDTFDAKKLDYLGKAVRLDFPKPAPEAQYNDLVEEYGENFVKLGTEVARDLTKQEFDRLGDVTDFDPTGDIKFNKGKKFLDAVAYNQLGREKIELADAIINLLPGNYTALQRIKILEDAIGYTPKHVLNGETLDDVDDTAEQSKETS